MAMSPYPSIEIPVPVSASGFRRDTLSSLAFPVVMYSALAVKESLRERK